MNTTAIPPAPLTVEPPKRRWFPYVLAAIALLWGLGATGQLLNAEPAETITKTVEVPTAAPACLDVITHANRVMGLFRQGMNISADTMIAASTFDLQQMNALNARLDDLTPVMSVAADDYWASVDECKAVR